MDSLNLTLRQRKLLHLLQNKTQITTGAELARELNVSVRTIRSDIVEINSILAGYSARIHSEQRLYICRPGSGTHPEDESD